MAFRYRSRQRTFPRMMNLTKKLNLDWKWIFRQSCKHLLTKYLIQIVVNILILLLLYGIEELVKVIGIKVPSSVILMLGNFAFLILLSWASPKLFGLYEKATFPTLELHLKWMNLYFVPSFIRLPLSDAISVREAFMIMAIFIIGYVVLFALVLWVLILWETLESRRKKNDEEKCEDETQVVPPVEKGGVMAVDSTEDVCSNECASDSDLDSKTDHSSIDLLNNIVDYTIFFVIFIVGIPLFLKFHVALFLYLSITVLVFKTILEKTPKRYAKIFHPLIFTVGFTWFFMQIFNWISKTVSFQDSLRLYSTGRTYLYLFDESQYHSQWPGAGDFLVSLLDISIVSLSIPCFRLRKELYQNFIKLMSICTSAAVGCFFLYPLISYHLGVKAPRALAFMGRSVTMALGKPLIANIDGSVDLFSCTTLISGLLGVYLGDHMIRLLGWSKRHSSNIITVGMVLGINCGAVATAHLLNTNPRAAAFSSLSFVIYGLVMVIMSCIPGLVDIIHKIVSFQT
ncbi:BA75_04792T0 [Komagataella pastoris]|uniref:BA75_04792T0 n=1 Tax=Komagataella pastoris TaxID=4922 RepID=A0A1B2JHD5_PICPA|nr:BA75_04792T0 [Komagataella pastoris]